ncbi:bifunctional 2-keto-4-hydroxyglutarate aldolase/2-keto-3-deoxy-6-phosphogluconate aldolase [Lentilactobacillus buchneri]|uniref:2-dehydro-3-deoxyphosphogluconate aldolase / 4-hydroxy-2-oxoglutarate aldolase n=1 Tax=Lentilactobacillus buchneri subsp. silagei CD034 TaxID=1071400 RepID=J9W0C6_LENBU|nr:bifunctional 2-keto-4-hydroxyglutarate aldolase/2-keto-3-deoxy-6-phosphogluconate aldolase [Lentilactobacillus buchneri]MCC6100687.1 bifunctional 2-keto-4-hydroxyglutarate aldolase/2-keto-3-deoxy-6-phosphogluconate aldolase [Lactobacillus sp.]AFR99191.1 2-dehydro-3-deoxyphosphogluconate aldolase / 4- hydroxy-2-oxoglutarate aldolase [Lentilactobacillus buchneri subsp. silagei CD034]MCT2900632.1 bifunctional 4-hydroxy-2-oxoglutarate aldolase/2-dehydro-3-deoxy-phosphogluconate aldolase [Lentilac
MLQKVEAITKVANSGVVAVVRGQSKEESLKTAIACIEGGISGIELAFTAPHADETIAELNSRYTEDEAFVGAGTVLDPATARVAIIAGAKFIVSPSFNKDVAMLCNLYAIPYIPGCMTPTDIQEALSYGSDIIKLFPGSVVGQNMVSELHGPFPQASLMVTGGVSLDNMQEWFDKGATVLGAGGNLVGPAKTGNFDQVKKNAQAYRKQIDIIKSSK